VRLHEGGRTLEFARQIDLHAVDALSPERRANCLIDLTEANATTGNYQAAVRALEQAEHLAPEEVRCCPPAHGLLRLLLNNTNGEHGRLVRAMAERVGVDA
jgi:hypothetical protein